MDQSDSARSADSYYWRIAVLLPGFAALGLGVLYAAGAVIKTGQLQDAELVVRDTLPLVPLEQILALGNRSHSQFDLSRRIVGVPRGLLPLGHPRAGKQLDPHPEKASGKSSQADKPPEVGRSRLRPVGGGAHRIHCRILALELPDLWGPVILGRDLLWLVGGHRAREGGRRATFLLFGGFVAVTIALAATQALVSPKPLPNVEIKTATHQPRRGVLVTPAGSTWYVSFAPRTFRGIPADQIEYAIVRSPESSDPQPALQWVWDQIK